MSDNRPDKITCYVHRGPEFFQEAQHLQRAIIIDPKNVDAKFTLDEVAGFVTSTNLVKPDELFVGLMMGGRYLILLPEGLVPEVFVRVVPQEVWNIGFTFQTWSLLDQTTVAVPRFRVWLEILDLPPELWREAEVIKLVSTFDTYIGSVNSNWEGNMCYWGVVVAVKNLDAVPYSEVINVGGMDIRLNIRVVRWIHQSLYTAEDFPNPAMKYDCLEQAASGYLIPSMENSSDDR